MLLPQVPQPADAFGASLALYRGVLAVGAPGRAQSKRRPDLTGGAVAVHNLAFLDVQVQASAYRVSESAAAAAAQLAVAVVQDGDFDGLDGDQPSSSNTGGVSGSISGATSVASVQIGSARCNGECTPPTRGGVWSSSSTSTSSSALFTNLGPVVEGLHTVSVLGHTVRCLAPADVSQPSGVRVAADAVQSTVFSPREDSVSEGVKTWTLRVDSVGPVSERLQVGVAEVSALQNVNHSHVLADEGVESYWLPGAGFAYEAQTGRLVNFSSPLGTDATTGSALFGSAVYVPSSQM